jgi:hypothetical protein
MSILSLPAELRLNVYSFVLTSSPLSFPHSAYAGLLYSCKAIYSELEPEIIKRATSVLRSIQDRCRAEHGDIEWKYDEPKCIRELYNMKVCGVIARKNSLVKHSSQFTHPSRYGMFARSDPFMALFYLHFSTLTITSVPPGYSYPPTLGGQPQILYRVNTSCLMQWMSPLRSISKVIRTRRVIYEWKSDPQPCRVKGWKEAIEDKSGALKVLLRTDYRQSLTELDLQRFDVSWMNPADCPHICGVEIERKRRVYRVVYYH